MTPADPHVQTASTTADVGGGSGGLFGPQAVEQAELLAGQLRRLGRAATAVAVATSPVLFLILYQQQDFQLWTSIAITILGIAAFRGLVDVVTRRMIPWPNLFGADQALLAEDVVSRRRSWFWKRLWHLAYLALVVMGIVYVLDVLRGDPASLAGSAEWLWDTAQNVASALMDPSLLILPLFFLGNLLILFGPMLFFGVQQIRGYEPGDADWGVKLDHVRGQAEAKTETTRIVNLWQSGEAFERAGGKRERGVLFLGPPGTGKTMLAKAIATGFNCPFVTIPGSGFAQTFIGMDVILVRYLARKAKKLAAKWGGQCIVFIDEIDAVGMRRASLGAGGGAAGGFARPATIHDYLYYGPRGAITPSGDLVLESDAWAERQFEDRAEPPRAGYPDVLLRLGGGIRNMMMPGMGGMGGGMALNQLLIVMDGIDDPPLRKRLSVKWANTWADALYIIPQRVGKVRLRRKPPKPANTQIYFIGACNVPIEALDPALTRPGRMGRHIRFRTPTKDDRKDIFEHYLDKVSHEPDLDTDRRRDELARMTGGYSPAMIEQVCSMALTHSHHDGRERFGWGDIVEAMTTVETGTAVGVEYVDTETRATAIHEAGHAAASHVYMKDSESTRLSIRMRGGSLGHHSAREREERFGHFRSEVFARLVWTMGAIAAEEIFYGENTTGVGGDMQSATAQAALMVGVWAMGPQPIDLGDRFATRAEEDAARAKILTRFGELGEALLSRGAGSGNPMMGGDPISAVLSDHNKRKVCAQIMGQAYFTAYRFIAQNRAAVENIAETLIERKELHGDEVVELLSEAGLKPADMQYEEERTWPRP